MIYLYTFYIIYFIKKTLHFFKILYYFSRFTLTVEDKFKDGDKRAKDTVGRYEDFGRNRIYLGADYQVNTNLNVYLKYGYEIRNMKKVNDGKSFDSNNYYGDFIVGWNYKF